jgi:NADH-quinone oxidoreductase subunit G
MSDVQQPAPAKTTLSITVDGRKHEAQPGQLVIDACADAGTYVPRFCYHPRMSPVGMCRQCLVEVEGPRGPMMVVSCMTPVADGQVVRTDTPDVKRAQEGVLELLLANHPLDCPVCDKGGECPLQDQAFSHGPGESRYVEEKRHYEKPIAISDLVFLDRERCILCDRCTRFADEVAGDKLIRFTHRGNNTQVLTFPEEPFASYFSGNTVQICPVGALTATPYRFKARPWDLDQAESTCTTCSVGCRTVVQSSRDELLRYQGLDSDAVNWGWLCDRGRFNFEAVNSGDRLGTPMARGEDGSLVATSWSVAISAAARLIGDAVAAGGASSVAVLGGARGTNEDAYAWAALADALGITHRDAQLGDGLPAELLGLPRATIDEAANAATIVLLAPDLKDELPVLYLRLRDAAEKRRSRILEISPVGSGLSPYAWRSLRVESGDTAAITAALGEAEMVEQLRRGPVVVVAGRANLAESVESATAVLAAVLAAVPDATVLPALRRGNVVGALQLGLVPQPGGSDGLGILNDAAEGRLECLVLLGADPLRDCPDADLATRALAGARRIVAVDTFLTESSSKADVVLAAAAYGEKSGTTTNLEGRVSTVAHKVTVAGTARPDWMIATELAAALGHDLGFGSVDDVTAAIATSVPAYAGITRSALAAHRDGLLAIPPAATLPAASSTAAVRNSYDYRLVVSRTLYDQATGTQMSPSLATLARGQMAVVNPLDVDHIAVAVGSSVKLIGRRASAVLTLRADERVPRGTVWVPFNQTGSSVGEIIDASAAVTDVRVERV